MKPFSSSSSSLLSLYSSSSCSSSSSSSSTDVKKTRKIGDDRYERTDDFDPVQWGLGRSRGLVYGNKLEKWKNPSIEMLDSKKQEWMKKHVLVTDKQIKEMADCKQQSEEWRKARKYRMGGSTFASFIGHNPYCTPEKAIDELIEPTFAGNDATRRGQALEPYARKELLRKERKRFMNLLHIAITKKRTYVEYAYRKFPIPEDFSFEKYEPAQCYNIVETGTKIHKKWPWISSSSDGDIEIFGIKVGIIEIKSPANNKIYPLSPTYYFAQVQGNMFVHEVGFCLFVCYADLDDVPFRVDHYEYDPMYCEDFLFPSLHKIYFTSVINAFLEYEKVKTPREKFLQIFQKNKKPKLAPKTTITEEKEEEIEEDEKGCLTGF